MAEIKAKIDWDTNLIQSWLAGYVKQAPFAIKQALNDVAFEARDSIGKAANQVFDKPTTFITKGWRVTKKAEKTDLEAIIEPAPKREPYLRANISGGARGVKRYEGAFKGIDKASVPGSQFFPTNFQKKNSYGNVSRSALSKIISSIQADESGRNSYFIGKPKGGNRPHGVYRRMSQTIRPVFLTSTSALTYRPVYNIKDIGGKVVARRFEQHLRTRLERAIRTAR